MEFSVMVLFGVACYLFALLMIMIALGHGVIDQRNQAREDAKASALEVASSHEKLRLMASSGADLATKVPWRKLKLMGGSEFRVYLALERMVQRSQNGHRLFSQVGFGGFLEVPSAARTDSLSKAAFHAVARKRADFLIIDRRGLPVVVIEYQGHDHYQHNAHDRDQAKRVACQRAGTRFLEVPPDGLTQGQRTDLETLLGIPLLSIAAE